MNKKQRTHAREICDELISVCDLELKLDFINKLREIFKKLSELCLNCEISLVNIPEWNKWYEKAEEDFDVISDVCWNVEDIIEEYDNPSWILDEAKQKLSNNIIKLSEVSF